MADIGTVLRIVTREPDPISACHLQLAVQEPITTGRYASYSPDPPPDRARVRLRRGRAAPPVGTSTSPATEAQQRAGHPIVEIRQP